MGMKIMKVIKNIKLVGADGIKENQAVVFAETIQEITAESRLGAGLEVIDGGGAFLSAGFIDLHIHGCAGYDVMDDDDQALTVMAKQLVSTGVTAFLPTTMTMEKMRIERALDRIKAAMTTEHGTGAKVLGANLEGPFLNPQNKGAHDEHYVIPPDISFLQPYLDVIRILTVAPEIEGALPFIQELAAAGIVVSIGHTMASFSEAVQGITAGASHVTHLFNAMTPLHHRQPGVVGAALGQAVTCELIADNIHVDPAVQLLTLKLKGLEQLVLITDAMRACLLSDGTYDLGGLVVHVKDRAARLENGSLAGSTLVLNQALRNYSENTGLQPDQAVKLVTVNPARILRLENRKGSIAPGFDADLVLWDADFNIIMTFVTGDKVFTAS